jgi:hypothetical protein
VRSRVPTGQSFQKQKRVKNYPQPLVLKPLKECSTPPQAQGYCRVSKYPGYPTGDKIWHPTRLLNWPTVGDPKSIDSMSAAQGANDKLYLA